MADDQVAIWGHSLIFGRAPVAGEILVGDGKGFILVPVGITISPGPNPPAGTIVLSHTLTVEGLIESTQDGFKFPDGSIQNTAAVSGPSLPLSVANGGTGVNSLTSAGLLIGNGTGPVGFLVPGAAGTGIISNGTAFVSGEILPSQTGNAGMSLFTNGTNASWSPNNAIAARASITNGTSAATTVGTGAINVSGVTQASGVYTVTFSTELASANYQVLCSIVDPGAQADRYQNRISSKATTGFTITTYDISGNSNTAVNSLDFVVFGGL